MEGAIEGAVENGRRGQLVAERLFTGEVGVRERGEALELAWLGKASTLRGDVEATLDGEAVRITALRARDLTATVPLRQRKGVVQAIVATAARV